MHQHLLTSKWVRDKYYISGNTLPNYGVLILSKVPSFFYEMPLPSKMGRSMLICEPLISYGNESIPSGVATVHLESGGEHDSIRKEQLKMCLSKLKESYNDNSILMGDFNFGDDKTELQSIIVEEGFNEISRDCGDSMGKKKGFERGWRPDKVLIPKDFEKWFSPKDIRTVGKFKL